MPTPPVLNIHSHIIKVMKELGFIADAGGVCNGIAYAYAQAVACKAEDEFNERIQLICHPEFLHKMNEYKNK